MRFFIFFICFLIIINQVFASEELLNSRKAEVKVEIDGTVNIEHIGGYSEVDYVEALLYWFPKNTESQTIIEITPTPDANQIDDYYHFLWISPTEEKLKYSLNSKVLTNSNYIKVNSKIDFPIKKLDSSLIKYTENQEIIDINSDIKKLASNLASGKDDLYEVVFALADYSRTNIEYELDSLTVEASQKSSWVLENKKGVCDELTSLFISMVRSLGIPAKFISGISYSNIESFENPWQAHGWAEVYFPGVGWLPFDVTYGEYGWLDSSHIKLRETIDANRAAAEFKSKGRSFDLKSGELDISGEAIDPVGRPLPSAKISLEPVWNGIAIGSYNVVKVTLENPYDYYVSDSFQFARVNGMEIFLPESTHFLLKPRERKELRYLIRISDSLSDDSYYAFPLQLITDREVSVASSFRVEPTGTFYFEEDAQNLLNLNLESSGFGNLVCSPENNFLYEKQTLQISCVSPEEDVKICFNNECKESNNGVNFMFTPENLGFQTLEVKMYRGDLLGSSYFSIEVLPKAEIQILDIGSEDMLYGEDGALKLKFSNDAYLKSLKVTIKHDNFEIVQTLNNLEASTHELTFLLKSTNLYPGDNSFTYTIDFVDKKDKIYTQVENDSIKLEGSPWHHKLWAFFSKSLGKLF